MAALDIVTTVLVPATATEPAGPYDLTSLARVKLELDINNTTYDPLLSDWISEESARAAAYCNHVFAAETVQDQIYPPRDAYPYEVPGRVGALKLTRWPVALPPVTLQTASDTPSGNVLALTSTTGVVVGQPVAHAAVPAGTVVTGITVGVSVTLSNPVNADVPAGANVTFGLDVRVIDPPGTTTLLTFGQDYLVEKESGLLTRLNKFTAYPTSWDPVLTTVTYVGGYASIPLDLASACLTLLAHRWAARTRDPYLKGVTIDGVGSKQFWVGGTGDVGDLPPSVEAALDRYRDIPV